MSVVFLTALAVKATVLSGAALLCLFFSRRSPAGTRHLICSGFFGALLSLPILLLVMPAWLPESAVPVWLHAVASAGGDSGTHATFPVWQTAIQITWIAGMVSLLVRLGIGFVSLKREVRRGEPMLAVDWQSDLAGASEQLGLQTPLIQLSVGRVNSAVTFGFWEPVILLPREATEWSALSRETVLLHELAHIRRGDWLWNCVAQIGLALFWFHPLVWVLYGVLRREEEVACDDAALLCGIAPEVYAGVLLEMTRNVRSPFLLASGMSGNAAHLRDRFRHILQKREGRPTNAHAGKAALAFLALVLAGCTSFPSGTSEKVFPSGTSEKVYKIGGDVSAPTLISRVDPEYSDAARKDKLQGTTLLAITVGADGMPSNVRVSQSLRPDLDAKAIAAVQQWRFRPAIRQGKAVATTANVEVNFKLL
jgi:TonB family protein